MGVKTVSIDLTGLELLVVEDDPVSRMTTTRMLEKYGAKVVVASDGYEGMRIFEDRHFPIVITDINMPGMSGIELVAKLKSIDPGVKAIATSAICDTDCLISAIETGFSDYVLKPLVVEKLLLAIKRCNDILIVRRQLASEQEKCRIVLESLVDGIIIKDLDQRITYQNRAMTEMFGERVGSACYQIFGHESLCPDCPTVKVLQDHQPHSSCRSHTFGKKIMHIESTVSLIRDSGGEITGTVEIIRDISERVKNEETIRELAFHDPLTGLSNRRLFEDRLEQAIAKSHRYGMKFGLLYMDLDHFKLINDSYGHEAGDLVLVEAAQRIRGCCKRDLDTISRHGGDEFCIIVTDCGSRENLTLLLNKLQNAFDQPFMLPEAEVRVTISIGVAVFPDNSLVPKELQIAADRAMYAAKKAGRNRYCFWEPGWSKEN